MSEREKSVVNQPPNHTTMAVTINLLQLLLLFVVVLQLLVSNSPVEAFQPSTRSLQQLPQSTPHHLHLHLHQGQYHRHLQQSALLATIGKDNDVDNDNDGENKNRNDSNKNNNDNSPTPAPSHPRARRRLRFAPLQFLRRCRRTLTIASIATVTATFFGGNKQQNWMIGTQAAHASAPVMAMPKAEGRDPGSEALLEQERRMTAAAQKELQDISAKARQIEAAQGKGARQKFEKQVQEQKQQQAAEKAAGLVELKRNLLRQGIDPNTDIEGKRQVIFYEKGIDLGDVPGTPFHLEKELERTSPKRSIAVQKKAHREAVACMVQDMENRGDIDPVEYFAGHQDKTMALMDLPTARVNALLQEYKTNLEQYGQITVPKPGEMSAKEKMALREQQQQKQQAAKDPAAKKAAREQAKRAKAEQQAKAKAEREQIKAERKAERERARAQARATKEEAKQAKQAAKAAATAAAAAAAATGAATAVGSQAAGAGLEVGQPQQQQTATATETVVEAPMQGENMIEDAGESAAAPSALSPQKVSPSPGISPFSVVTGVAVVGGGGYMFKFLSDKAAKDEDERQRQFRLLMGDGDSKDDSPSSSSSSSTTATLDEIGTEGDIPASPKDTSTASTPATSAPAPAPEPVIEAPKKQRRLGIKKMFGKKSDRVTDLNQVVGEGGKAPEFATLLAKILTFGAPGRFPAVLQLGGGEMPMDTFDLETAKKLLSEQREASGLELKDSAEIFADVVNCMLIDIVDLASTSLKEKDDDVTIKSINIVVDFMNHAASLYDSVAEGVVIKPVTYGGNLSKGKLEQMYSTYAVSGMMGMFGGSDGESNLADDFDNRVALLQDVFQISEKKAEGLMMKAVQKNMMEMLKDGKGMEGMEEMLGGMSGLGGMPGMGEDGEGPSPEQLKEMLIQLKEMKDAGSIPAEEFNDVRKQFKEAFGANIDDFTKDVGSEGELSETDKELLDLMKAIMED